MRESDRESMKESGEARESESVKLGRGYMRRIFSSIAVVHPTVRPFHTTST